jgi:uncharacterized protein (DUF1778 family)
MRTGRPPKHPNVRRGIVLTVRVSDDELEILKGAAQSEGVSLSTFLRDTLLARALEVFGVPRRAAQ